MSGRDPMFGGIIGTFGAELRDRKRRQANRNRQVTFAACFVFSFRTRRRPTQRQSEIQAIIRCSLANSFHLRDFIQHCQANRDSVVCGVDELSSVFLGSFGKVGSPDLIFIFRTLTCERPCFLCSDGNHLKFCSVC